MDLFICGVCHLQFNDISKFMEHKKMSPHTFTCIDCSSFFHTDEELTKHKKRHESSLQTNNMTDNNPEPQKPEKQTEGNLNQQTVLSLTNSTTGEAPQQIEIDGIFMCKQCGILCLSINEVYKHLKEIHEKDPTPTLISQTFNKLIPINSSDDDITFQVDESGIDLKLCNLPQLNETPKKKRGRPRKNKDQPPTPPEEKKKVIREKPVVDGDGKYHCSGCSKIFGKERHFLVHRCWGANAEHGDYIDLRQKELIESGENKEEESVNSDWEEEEEDSDPTDDYKVYLPVSSRLNGKRSKQLLSEGNKQTDEITTTDEIEINIEKSRNTIHSSSVPVFNNNEERKEFEDNINNVDLSCVDDLFTTHLIQQELNEMATKFSKDKEQLQIFSCTICKKVFKTLSHIRLHCLIHTDLKPFKCPRCAYSSNAKGNLYTHMRKHTGNLYKCSFCNFRSCNRSHMAEHEATHSKTRHVCQICSNDYNTVKSLANHVRKYHSTSKEGREYLSTFMLKSNQNAAVLHQCNVCNRKFKKKLDRDRHLFVHNINPINDFLQCEMCNYTNNRRTYLENHFKKHRIVYICSECDLKFQSSVQLQEHLHTHVLITDIKDREVCENNPSIGNSFSSLFETSVNCSWYLPEPDGVLNAYKYANIPEELVVSSEDDAGELKTCEDEQVKISLSDLLTSLKYKQMSMEIYNKIRETFGNEECRFCGRLFHAKSDCDIHLRTHNSDRPFKCDVCEYSSITKENLKRHVETVHEKKKFSCDQCEFIATSRTSLWHHQQKHRESPIDCPECNKKFGSCLKLQTHIICAHPQINRKDISKIIGLKRKVQSRLGRRSYKCPYCDRVFLRSNTDLQKHIWIHEGVKPYKCPLCPHSCRSRNNLNVHMLRHSNDKPHSCKECGKTYKSKTALKWHCRTHSSVLSTGEEKAEKADPQTDNSDEHKTVSETSTVKCINCENVFDNLSELKDHLKENHQLNVIDTTSTDIPNDQNAQLAANIEESYELVQVETEEGISLAWIPPSALHDLQMAGSADSEMDATTASAVNIIQQSSFATDNDFQQIVTINSDSMIIDNETETQIILQENVTI